MKLILNLYYLILFSLIFGAEESKDEEKREGLNLIIILDYYEK
jgi:hypothetical protein